MPNMQTLFGILDLHSLAFKKKKGTSSSLMVFNKNIVDMDIVTCCKWIDSKLGY